MDTVNKLYSDRKAFTALRSKTLQDFIQISFYLQFSSVQLLQQKKRRIKKGNKSYLLLAMAMNKYSENTYLVAYIQKGGIISFVERGN